MIEPTQEGRERMRSLMSDDDESDIVHDVSLLSRHEDLGDGSYGSVWSAAYRGQAVAVKRFKKDVAESTVNREVEIMKLMKGEFHVVQFLGRFVDEEGRSCIVMELAYNVSLKMLCSTTGLEFSQNLKIRIARDVCRSLECLHKKGIMHEVVKSENVLLDFGLRAKLCDFGTAMFPDHPFAEKNGTQNYWAPEKRLAECGQAYDRMRSDIYSLGKVLEGIFGKIPIVVCCLAENPTDRPANCGEILSGLPELNRDDDLGYRDFSGVSAHTLGVADRINLAFYWTGSCDPESENPEVKRARKHFYQGNYKEALELFSQQSCETAVANVFLGIMRFHGYGCDRDVDAALELFENCLLEPELYSDNLTFSLVQYYVAMIRISKGKAEEMQTLSKLSNLGNAFAQVELSRLFALSANLDRAGFIFAPLLNGSSRNVLDHLHKAAKTGYAHAQAMLALFYISRNMTRNIPPKERDYLQRSIEAGSLVGQILLDFVNGTIDVLPNSTNGALLEFVADLYSLIGKPFMSLRCYEAAAKLGRESSSWAAATTMKGCQDRSILMHATMCLKKLMAAGFNSVADNDCYFFRMPRHRTTVEYELAENLMMLGAEKEAMEIVLKSSDTSSRAMEALLNLCSRGGARWNSILTEKRSCMSADIMRTVAASFKQQGHIQEALEWYEEAVKSGSTSALTDFAKLHFDQGNRDMALELWNRGLEEENPLCMMQMAICIKGNGKKALLERAARIYNEPLSMVELAKMLRFEKKLDEAERMLKNAWIYGVDRAAMELVFLIVSSRPQGFDTEAKYWFRHALRNVQPQILYNLGCAYEEHDLFDLISMSTQLSDSSDTLFNMGMLCDAEAGGMEPSLKAYDFFARAAQMNNRHAAHICLRHCLVREDNEGAARWKEHLESRGDDIEQTLQIAAEWKLALHPRDLDQNRATGKGIEKDERPVNWFLSIIRKGHKNDS